MDRSHMARWSKMRRSAIALWWNHAYGLVMCGIAGLFAKSSATEERLGAHLAAMLERLAERGPDSAGVAVYREPSATLKLSVLDRDTGATSIVAFDGEPSEARARLARERPELTLLGLGHAMELAKRVGHPAAVADALGLRALSGTHALGHTRMATESAVTTEGSHPFSTGPDLCLVHNGSLSNHNRLRQQLREQGMAFQTENDTEVAAGYVAWRLREGATLHEALEGCLEDLDGFFTFLVGTADGFAVLRDPIACKPAVLAETDDWVAMASEYRAIAVLPGAEEAKVWEPEPARVYSWARERV
jgi:glutamate synthase domain-containing protein 1